MYIHIYIRTSIGLSANYDSHVIVVLFAEATTVVSIPHALAVSRLLLSSFFLNGGSVVWNKELWLIHRDASGIFAFLFLENLVCFFQFELFLPSFLRDL